MDLFQPSLQKHNFTKEKKNKKSNIIENYMYDNSGELEVLNKV